MKTTILQTILCAIIFLGGCNQQKADKYLENLPLQGFKYPVAALLKDKYPLDAHYAITIFDEGVGGTNYIIVQPSEQNQIGSKNAVDEATFFEMNNSFYQYAAFYDNWMIKESVQIILDKNGIFNKSITIKYDENGTPVEYSESSEAPQ